MQKIADKCVELVRALKNTYEESSIPKDKPFSALFLDPLDQYLGRDHRDVVADLYSDMPSKSRTQKEQARIEVACLLADMAFNTYEDAEVATATGEAQLAANLRG